MDIFYLIIFFIFGTVFGSFFNVVGMRLPKNESLIKPGSHCTKCNHALNFIDLIPVISYFLRRGKCKYCGTKLSIFYPLTEILSGILFAVCFQSFGFSYSLGIGLVLVSATMIVFVSDILYFIIPDSVTIVGSILVFVLTILEYGFKQALFQLGFALVTLIVMLLLMKVAKRIFKKDALGGGDVKLMFLIGLSLHPYLIFVCLFLASVIALPVALVLEKRNKDKHVPFGPFILISCLVLFLMKVDPTIWLGGF